MREQVIPPARKVLQRPKESDQPELHDPLEGRTDTAKLTQRKDLGIEEFGFQSPLLYNSTMCKTGSASTSPAKQWNG